MQARLLFTMKIDQVAVALRHLDRRLRDELAALAGPSDRRH